MSNKTSYNDTKLTNYDGISISKEKDVESNKFSFGTFYSNHKNKIIWGGATILLVGCICGVVYKRRS
tara:strand:+ start:183 stop:383 length:201 start_codon:yes stop_codon:yes gene_type:complete